MNTDYVQIQRLAESFLKEAKDLTSNNTTEGSPSKRNKGNDTNENDVPSSLRQRKLMEVNKMLEKE